MFRSCWCWPKYSLITPAACQPLWCSGLYPAHLLMNYNTDSAHAEHVVKFYNCTGGVIMCSYICTVQGTGAMLHAWLSLHQVWCYLHTWSQVSCWHYLTQNTSHCHVLHSTIPDCTIVDNVKHNRSLETWFVWDNRILWLTSPKGTAKAPARQTKRARVCSTADSLNSREHEGTWGGVSISNNNKNNNTKCRVPRLTGRG